MRKFCAFYADDPDFRKFLAEVRQTLDTYFFGTYCRVMFTAQTRSEYIQLVSWLYTKNGFIIKVDPGPHEGALWLVFQNPRT